MLTLHNHNLNHIHNPNINPSNDNPNRCGHNGIGVHIDKTNPTSYKVDYDNVVQVAEGKPGIRAHRNVVTVSGQIVSALLTDRASSGHYSAMYFLHFIQR